MDELRDVFQYIHWVQNDKLRLINETLSQSEPESENVTELRFRVCLMDYVKIYLIFLDAYASHRNCFIISNSSALDQIINLAVTDLQCRAVSRHSSHRD